ncbi:MAG TPA: class I SAM-dependent methyltransferase [Bryobacteraceae bacterium]|nr:class I SAM-dependent methyltransferase [Bryobacteraceae bacterium]
MRGTIHHLVRLMIGTTSEREQICYLAKATIRGVDLSGATVEDLKLSRDRSSWYSNSGGPILSRALDELAISGEDSAVDVGCGKGGAILTMACYPFRQVDGIEISPELSEIARRNLKRMGIRNARVYCSDAASFEDLDRYSFVYLFNPFPALVMNSVLGNIAASLRRQPRVVRVLYRNPACYELLLAFGYHLARSFHHDPLPIHLYVKQP